MAFLESHARLISFCVFFSLIRKLDQFDHVPLSGCRSIHVRIFQMKSVGLILFGSLKNVVIFFRKALLITGICFSFRPENGKHLHTLAEEKLE